MPAIGDPLCKNTTFAQIEDIVRLRTNTISDMQVPQSLVIKETCFAVQKWAKILSAATTPFYQKTVGTLVITGASNPYSVDLSALNPFIDRIIRVVHKTTGGTRTLVKMLNSDEAEKIQSLTTLYSSSIFGVHEGDSIKLYVGATFTITTGTDTIELQFYRQPIVSTAVTPTIVADAAFTVASDGVTVSAFTGAAATHVGGTFIGTDSAAGYFARNIVAYIGSTSFVIASAVVAGAGTNGYILPPGSALVGSGAYPDIPDSFVPTIIDEVVSKVQMYKNNGQSDQGLLKSLEGERQSILTAYGMSEQQASALAAK